jgi:hypothetical protein
MLDSPIETGDAGIVIKADGSVKIFNTHKHLDHNNMTHEQLAQGEKLLALAVALSTPEIMNLLIEMSNDPRFVGNDINLGSLN